MIKSIYFSTILLLGALSLSSCSQDDINGLPETPTVPVDKLTITFASSENGIISLSGAQTASEGSILSSTATPAKNYILDAWYDGENKITTSGYLKVSENTLSVKLTKVTANKVYTAKFIKIDNSVAEDGSAAPRIYVSGTGDDAKLELTCNPKNPGTFFQYGSVIAWSSNDPIQQEFTPSMLGAAWSSKWQGKIPHTANNIKFACGDPCRLVGYTQSYIISEIRAGRTPDNKTWRMPTSEEFKTFLSLSSNWTTLEGVNGRYFGPGATPDGTGGEFLPASGQRDNNASLNLQNERGIYWTSSRNGLNFAHCIFFNKQSVTSNGSSTQPSAFPVRCVRQNS